MSRRGSTVLKALSVAVTAAASVWTIQAQEPTPEAQLKTATTLLSDRQYEDAYYAYHKARASNDASVRVAAGVGAVRSLLRVGAYTMAKGEGAEIAARDPRDAVALAIYGDALWASGLFFEAEDQYAAALKIDPKQPAALHGRGRSLAAQHRFDDALADLTQAARLGPTEAAYEFSLAAVYEQLRRYPDAANSLTRFLALTAKHEDDDLITWAQGQVRVLRAFKSRQPFQIMTKERSYTVPFTVEGGRVLVKARVNGGRAVDFTLDTGVDQIVLTPSLAYRAAVMPITTLQSAGIGDSGYGFRNLQVSRIDQLEIGGLRIQNVSAIVKDPVMRGLPTDERESFSPLALGLSMRLDYGTHTLTMATDLPEEPAATRLPLRMQRLALVRAMINGSTPASFVIDTGGEGTALGRRLAQELTTDPDVRKVPARVYGSSGWDRRAFLLPFTSIELARGVGLEQKSLVVLNLDAPSGLLGFNIGGILGGEFLSKYKISIDLKRHEVGLQPIQQ